MTEFEKELYKDKDFSEVSLDFFLQEYLSLLKTEKYRTQGNIFIIRNIFSYVEILSLLNIFYRKNTIFCYTNSEIMEIKIFEDNIEKEINIDVENKKIHFLEFKNNLEINEESFSFSEIKELEKILNPKLKKESILLSLKKAIFR